MSDFKLRLRRPRQCGTCRFYQPSPIEGAGWCRNLLRVGKDDLVLVRRWELACRNGWGKDDWQPAEGGKRPPQPLYRTSHESLSQLGPRLQSTVRPEDVQPWPEPKPLPRHRVQAETAPFKQAPDLPLTLSRDSLLPDHEDPSANAFQNFETARRKWRQAALSEHPGKRCANCAFFVSTSPGKGMCRNGFAFDQETPVSPQDLACLSTLGHWWQPRSNLLLAQDAPAEAPRRS